MPRRTFSCARKHPLCWRFSLCVLSAFTLSNTWTVTRPQLLSGHLGTQCVSFFAPPATQPVPPWAQTLRGRHCWRVSAGISVCTDEKTLIRSVSFEGGDDVRACAGDPRQLRRGSKHGFCSDYFKVA